MLDQSEERDVSAAAAGTTNDLQMAGMARSAEERERVCFKDLGARHFNFLKSKSVCVCKKEKRAREY